MCVLTTGKKLKVRIANLLEEDDFEIIISDADLEPGEPIYYGLYGYRVNIFGGETAGRYTQSTGFVTADPVYILGNLAKGVIVSDNWVETITTADEICDLLDGGFLLHPISN